MLVPVWYVFGRWLVSDILYHGDRKFCHRVSSISCILIERASPQTIIDEVACVPQMQKGNEVARTVHIGK